MGVSPALARELARQTRAVYEQATTDLIRGIARQVAAGADAADWQTRKLESMNALRREADEVMTRLDDEVPGTVEEALTSAYRQGTRTASSEAARAGITGGFGADADREGITRLLEEALRPHRQAILQIRRGTLDAFDDAITTAAGRVLTGTGTRRDAARSALGVLADKGITGYRDASGRQWDLASYAEMATRTSAGHAAIEGHMARLTTLDADLVFVSDSPEECSICRPFEGRVLSISGKTRGRLDDGVTVLCSVTEARDAGLYHPNAILGDHSLEAVGGVKGAVRAWYEGPSIELTTASGVRFTVSPNHPVFTTRGWVAAERLRKGDQLFQTADRGRGLDGTEVHQALDHVVPRVADQFDALRSVGSQASVPAASDHLHGDGKFCQGEIDVVVADPGLLPVGDAQAVEDAGDLILGRPGMELLGLTGPGAPDLGLAGVGGPVRGALTDWLTSSLEASQQGLPADAEDPREVVARLPGAVAADELVDVHRNWFRGHAYDFQTGFGAYFLNGILVHNCTHSQSIYLPGFTDLPTDTADPVDAGLREQQRAYERRVRGWKRRVELDEQVYGKQSPEAKRTRQRLRGTHAEFKAWRDKHDRRPVPGRTNLTHR